MVHVSNVKSGLSVHLNSLLTIAIAVLLISLNNTAQADESGLSYSAEFSLHLTPGKETATASLTIDQAQQIVERMRLRMPPERYRLLSSDGSSRREGDFVYWVPPAGRGQLHYEVVLQQPRGKGFDGLVTPEWAIFRGDDSFPTVRVEFIDGAHSRSRLILQLPEQWKQITPYETDRGDGWQVDNPNYKFDRPTGWILVGRMGIKRDTIAGIRVAIAAPVGARAQRVSMLALLQWNLGWLAEQAPTLPDRLLIVSGPDPLWRGGLSATNSLFLHADLPLISEDGSSPLLHEIAHVLFPVDAAPEADWIDEGLAEYLSLRVLRETGSISASRYRNTIKSFRKRGQQADSLSGKNSRGAVTARAVTLFHDLNAELTKSSDGKLDMMDLTRRMMASSQALTLANINTLAEDMLGGRSASLSQELKTHNPVQP